MLKEFKKHMDHEPKIFFTYILQPITEKKKEGKALLRGS
jgi:hypothetical protein